MNKKQPLLVITLFIGLSQILAQNVFDLKFAFRHSDSARAVLQGTSATVNTAAMVYNPTVNEIWMASYNASDTLLRYSVPKGQYLGAYKMTNMAFGNASRYLRQMTVKDDFFIWAANNTDTLRQINPRTGAVVARKALPKWMGSQNMITYDSTRGGGFWLAGFSYVFRRLDTTLTRVTDSVTIPSTFITGGTQQVVFDPLSIGGPYLWMLNWRHSEFPELKPSVPANSSASAATLMQFSLTTGRPTGVYKTILDDFDFTLNVNQAPQGLIFAKIPNFAKPFLIVKVGKSSGSTLLSSDLSGVTAGYQLDYRNRPDASIDSMALTPNLSMVPTLLARPFAVSAKTRNVVAYQNSSGNLSITSFSQSGQTLNTQSVPFNLSPLAIQQVASTSNIGNLTKGLNRIVGRINVNDDAVSRNDTLTAYVDLTDSTIAKDYIDRYPILTSSVSLCVCPGSVNVFTERAEVGQAFKMAWPITISSVTARLKIGRAGDTMRFKVYEVDAQGKPSKFLGQSGLYVSVLTDSINSRITIPMTAPIRIAANQEFLVSMTDGGSNPFVSQGIYGTREGYEKGKVMFFSQTGNSTGGIKGWFAIDTIPGNIADDFSRNRNLRALAIRPNVQVRTDIENVSNIAHINVSPNPTTGLLTLETELTTPDDMAIHIHTIAGQIVYKLDRQDVKNARETIDLSRHAAGVYILSVKTAKGIAHRKIIKE